jgi:type IV pilus assembly protein PilE
MPAPAANPPAFTLTLTPKDAQAKDKCGTLAITQTGARTAAAEGCW